VTTIERVGAAGWQRVHTVRLRALRDAPDAFWTSAGQDAAQPPEVLRARLERPETVHLVAARPTGDVGLVVGAPHRKTPENAALHAMWVAPEARGTGVGAALVAEVVTWAKRAGYRRLRLDVVDTNEAAIGLYDRLGFHPTGVTGAFPPPRDHLTEHERALDLH
jgi:GNAT superfamily N-acetyltransferase